MWVRWRRLPQEYLLQASNPSVSEVGTVTPTSFKDAFKDETAEVWDGVSGGYKGREEHICSWDIPVAKINELESLVEWLACC